MSGDGRYVVFHSAASNLVPGDTNSASDVFVHDRQTGTTTRVSVSSSGATGTGESGFPAISSDGRFVAFASNLVAGDTNASSDIFVRDLFTGQTSRVTSRATARRPTGPTARCHSVATGASCSSRLAPTISLQVTATGSRTSCCTTGALPSPRV